MRRLRLLLALATVVGLSLFPLDGGSFAFVEGDEFAHPCGWPFGAVAFANDEGAILVRASVVQGATRISLGVFDGPYPHLAWNLIFVVMDLLVAALLVAGVYRIVPRLGMLPNQPQESASRKASNRES